MQQYSEVRDICMRIQSNWTGLMHNKFTTTDPANKTKSVYRLSITGHSLGTFLAEMLVFFVAAEDSKTEVNALTFESPRSGESMH